MSPTVSMNVFDLITTVDVEFMMKHTLYWNNLKKYMYIRDFILVICEF